MATLALLLTFSLLRGVAHHPARQGGCGCRAAAEVEAPRGGNEDIVITEGKPVKQLRGVVVDVEGSPMKDAVVEVFRYRRGDGRTAAPSVEGGRLAARKAAADGRFCFKGLSPGGYVLRAGTLRGGFNYTYVVIRLAPRAGTGRQLRLYLQMAT